ncbi:hypothetical protein C7451_10232 [Blastomonas natatoria]|uniref:Uncharacterized protein n=1 Tax=Blastomonas natatoria TaxID=34015 RepID=A0A2V3V962_9SPHN|nr:hypothetical protein C7451_10232 [Blastomonas natatoria]
MAPRDLWKPATFTELPYVNVKSIRPYVKNGFLCQITYHFADSEVAFGHHADISIK